MPEPRRMLIMEMAADYTGYPDRYIRAAVARGDLHAERPGGKRGRLYFDEVELDRWIESIKVGSE